MGPRRQQNTRQAADRIIRFADDPSLTFVNYNPENRETSGYTREARLHNAHRRSSRPGRGSRANPVLPRERQTEEDLIVATPTTLLNPLSTYGRDPFSQDVLIPPQNLEAIWRSVFSFSFHLPQVGAPPPGFPDPADAFLSAARVSQDIYRTLVVQTVVTAEANRGNQANEAVFRNQALIIRDFRRLIDSYDSPTKYLSKEQFEHIFATAFSMSTGGFDQQAGYDAILFVNSLFMFVPHNKAIPQTPVTDWIRMLLPRPGPAFNRSVTFQREMLRKITLTLDFFERMRDSVNNKFPDHISRFLVPGSAIYRVVTTKLPNRTMREPYPDFFSICRHRFLSMLYRYLGYLSELQPPESERLLLSLQNSASYCLRFPPEHCIALFVWCLIANSEETRLNNDIEEQLFAWALKDLLPMHRISIADEMAAWLLSRCSSGIVFDVPTPNFQELREMMQQHYSATREVPSQAQQVLLQ